MQTCLAEQKNRIENINGIDYCDLFFKTMLLMNSDGLNHFAKINICQHVYIKLEKLMVVFSFFFKCYIMLAMSTVAGPALH